ncbi:MAG: NADPH quinone oxidoreductase [Rhodospirillaceae bacterium]|nr:NADPH quinone oxidoreductase [Rhodospirillaceae bacterium]
MRVFIVHAHHEPKSFNGALTEAARDALLANGHEVRISDLYAMDFDPISDRRNFKGVGDADYLKQQAEESFATQEGGFADDIEAELEKLDWCDVLIFQFPLWWFGLPAILKGWVDRIFAMDRIYGGGYWFDEGYFKGKRAMLSLTTGGGPGPFSEGGITGDIHTHLNSINYGIFRFVGFDVLPPFIAWAPARIGEARRKDNIEQYVERVLAIPETEPIAYLPLSDYDPKTLRLKTDE